MIRSPKLLMNLAKHENGFLFSPLANAKSLAIEDSTQRFPILRVFCVARNYRDHALEMGANPDREEPFFFTKSAQAVVDCSDPMAVPEIAYPPFTSELHHEGELVVALSGGGARLSAAAAAAAVFGYGAGVDLTCRDLQAQLKQAGRPWEAAKAFDSSAPMGALAPAASSSLGPPGALGGAHPGGGAAPAPAPRVELAVNGEIKQSGSLDQLIWNVPDIISKLSHHFTLYPGDLIFTGTPAGVGPLVPGDEVTAAVEGLPLCRFTVGEPPSL